MGRTCGLYPVLLVLLGVSGAACAVEVDSDGDPASDQDSGVDEDADEGSDEEEGSSDEEDDEDPDAEESGDPEPNTDADSGTEDEDPALLPTMEVFRKARIQGDANTCLGVGAAEGEETPVQAGTCGAAAQQYWDVDEDGSVHPWTNPEKCLSASEDGAALQIRDCADAESQRWQVSASGAVRNLASGLCLDVADPAAEGGAVVALADCEEIPGQTFAAVPQPFTYVAIGDSYAAGAGLAEELGAMRQFDDDAACQRHLDAYPSRVATALQARDEAQPVEFSFLACSGARIDDAIAQMQGNPDVLARADLVTVTIGGNDLDWPDVLQRCATFWNLNPLAGEGSCTNGEGELVQRVQDMLQRLTQFTGDLRALTPRAQILIVGYPQIAPVQLKDDACVPFVAGMIDEAERNMTRMLGDLLNNGLTALAEATADTALIDLQTVYEGHEPCSEDEWINALRSDFDSSQSFHPKVIGHENAAAAVLQSVQ